jgi:glycosyltransferase involved in cell wall biosynthesis
MQLSIVVLAWNEADNLPVAVAEIHAAAEALAVDYELLLVDDGSTDGTAAIVDDLASRHAQVRAIHHPRNLGLGGGYRTGFAEASGEWLIFFPADGQFPARLTLPRFWQARDGVDLVLGHVPSRDDALAGKLLSLIERGLYRALFGGFPRFQGLFLLRRAVLAEVPLMSQGRGWAVVMELILRLSRGPYQVAHAPNELLPRRSGVSKVQNWRTIAANLRQLAELRRHL